MNTGSRALPVPLAANAQLTADIDTTDIDWDVPIGPAGTIAQIYYRGTFDGNGKTVTINGTAGLFRYIGIGALIKDLTVEGSVNNAVDTYLAGVAYYMYNGGEINNVTNNAAVTSPYTFSVALYVAGITGYATNGSKIIDCTNNGAIVADTAYPIWGEGGIVGYATGVATQIRDNVNNGSVWIGNPNARIGAVIGDASNVPLANITDNTYLVGSADRGAFSSFNPAPVFTDANVKVFFPVGVTETVVKVGNPANAYYKYHDLYDPAGLEVVILKDDGTTEPISADKITWDKTDPLEMDDTEIVVTVTPDGNFEPVTYTFKILIYNLKKLTVSGTLAKSIYKVGESFDPEGLTISADYDTAGLVPLTPDDYTVHPATFGANNTAADIVYTKDGTTVSWKITTLLIDPTPGTPALNDNGTAEDATDDYYELATADDLLWFSLHTQETPTLKAKLMNDIDATSLAWRPIGAGAVGLGSNRYFQGEFDGDNHTITLDCDGQTVGMSGVDYSGLFYQVLGAYIHDLTVDGRLSGSTSYLGGVVSQMMGGKLENVTNKATVTSSILSTSGTSYVGGIVGSISGASELINVKNLGTITNTSGSTASVCTGGVAGYMLGNTAQLTDCSNEGTITSYGAATGGILGDAYSGILVGCTNSGSVRHLAATGTLNGVGGILGYHEDYYSANVTVTNCENTGQVSSVLTSDKIGSILGDTYLPISGVPGALDKITGNRYLVGTAENGLGGRYVGIATDTNARVFLPEGMGAALVKKSNPAKLTGYFEGQTFDIAGFKAAVVLYDGTETEVAADKITWDKTDPLAAGDKQVTVTVTPGGSLAPVSYVYTISVIYVDKLAITVQPTNKAYADGDAFDKTGMVVKLGYSNWTYLEPSIEDYTVAPALLSAGDTSVMIKYTYNGKAFSAAITGITVSGTQTEPSLVDGVYQIATADDLMWFARKVNAATNADGYANASINAKLTADIDVTDKVWVPIGGSNATTAYKGVFDGDNHTITVNIDTPSSQMALFNNLFDATVRDLTVAGQIKNATYAAGFAYNAQGATALENLTNKVSIDAVSIGAGILVAYDGGSGGYIKNCHNEGAIKGGISAAGTVFSISAAAIEVSCCSNAGTITTFGTNSGGVAAGIIGKITKSELNGNSSAAALVINNTNTATVTHYSVPLGWKKFGFTDVSMDYPATGGIVGYAFCPGVTISGNSNTGTISNSATVPADVQRYDYMGGVIGFALTEENFADNTTTTGVLIGSRKDYDSGAGTKDDPFIITTAFQLDQMRLHQPAFYKQGANIDLTDYIKDSAVGWMPITPNNYAWSMNVSSASSYTFFGGLDGAGYEISGLWIDIPGAGSNDVPAVGLFGYCSGELKNINVVLDAKGITARSLTGGLVGNLLGGFVDNCTVSGDGAINGFSSSGGARLGGIVGLAAAGTSITNSTNYVDVIGSGNYSISVGGIVGLFGGDLIDNCVNYGNIVGDAGVGGIAGMFGNGTISNSTNNGTVTGNYNGPDANISGNGGYGGYGVGGIAGNTSDGGTITGSTNNGQVTGTDSVAGVGSIIGSPGNNAQLSDNQYLEGTGNAVGGWTYTATDDQARTYVPEPNNPGNPGNPNNPGNPVTPVTPNTPSGSTTTTPQTPSGYAPLSDTPTATTPAATTPRPETRPETPAADTPRENTPDTTPAPLVGSEVVPTKQAQTFIEYVIDNPLLIPVGILALALIVGGAAFAYVRFKRNTEDSTTKHGS